MARAERNEAFGFCLLVESGCIRHFESEHIANGVVDVQAMRPTGFDGNDFHVRRERAVKGGYAPARKRMEGIERVPDGRATRAF
jgi:hypothetical protein